MAVFPGALVTFTDRTDNVHTVAAADVNTAYDEIEAIEAELGVNPSGAAATVAARFTAVEARQHDTWAGLGDDHTIYALYGQGTDAAKGTPSRNGALYLATDTVKVYWGVGGAWVLVAALAHNDHTGLTTGDPHTQYFLKVGGQFRAYNEFRTSGNATGAVTLDPTSSNNYDYTLTGNATFSFANAPAGAWANITLVLRQDGTGGRTATFTGVKWSQGFVPAVSTAANSISLVTLLWTGVEWLGVLAGTSFA